MNVSYLNKKLFLTLLFPVLISISQLSHAQATYIKGDADCGQWLKARSLGASAAFEASVQGYVNGAVQATAIEVWHGKGVNTSTEAFFLYMDNYCKANPLDSIWQGAWAFINEKTNNAFIKLRQRGAK